MSPRTEQNLVITPSDLAPRNRRKKSGLHWGTSLISGLPLGELALLLGFLMCTSLFLGETGSNLTHSDQSIELDNKTQ